VLPVNVPPERFNWPVSTTIAPPPALGAWLFVNDVALTLAIALPPGLSNANSSIPPPPAAPELATLFVNVDPLRVSVSVVVRTPPPWPRVMSPERKLSPAPLVPE
jgi:hypothetical protein